MCRVQHESSVGTAHVDLIMDKKGSVVADRGSPVIAEVDTKSIQQAIDAGEALVDCVVLVTRDAESEVIQTKGKSQTIWHVGVAFQDSSMSGAGGGTIRIGGWGARKETVFPSGVVQGAVLKLEGLAIRKVNDGYDGVLRRLSSVKVLNGFEDLLTWHEGLVEELTDLRPCVNGVLGVSPSCYFVLIEYCYLKNSMVVSLLCLFFRRVVQFDFLCMKALSGTW